MENKEISYALELYLERPKKANDYTYHYETRSGKNFRESNSKILRALNIPIIEKDRRLIYGFSLIPANSLEEIANNVIKKFERETEGYFKNFFYSELHVYELNTDETLTSNSLEVMKLELLILKNSEIKIASPFRKIIFDLQSTYHLLKNNKSSIRRASNN